MSDPIDESHPCLYCMQPDVAHVRFDRRGNPYIVCDACGVRTFMKNMRALRGFAVFSAHARDYIERLRMDSAETVAANEVISGFLGAVRAKLDGAAARTPTTTSAASLTTRNEAPNGIAHPAAAAAAASR
jgi:transcription elongation factor Elf1